MEFSVNNPNYGSYEEIIATMLASVLYKDANISCYMYVKCNSIFLNYINVLSNKFI